MPRMMLRLTLAGVVLLYSIREASAADCTVTVAPLTFPAYLASHVNETTATTDVQLSCAGSTAETVTASVALDYGGYPDGRQRRLRGMQQWLPYQLYLDPAHLQVWGDGSLGAAAPLQVIVPPGGLVPSEAALTVHGAIAPGQWIPADSYSDIILVTVSF